MFEPTSETAPMPVPKELPPFYAGVVIWGRSGDLLLQLRDDIPGIVHPGCVSTFGGGGQAGEEPRQGAVREVLEETGLALDPDSLELLDTHYNVFEGGLKIPVYVFGARDVPETGMVITEGALFRVPPERLRSVEKITDACLRNALKLTGQTQADD